jgi:hypothetical protein
MAGDDRGGHERARRFVALVHGADAVRITTGATSGREDRAARRNLARTTSC